MTSRYRRALIGAFAVTTCMQIGAAPTAAAEEVTGGCNIQVSAPFRNGAGDIVGVGSTHCAGNIKLIERRILWSDRELARADFGAAAPGDEARFVIRLCEEGRGDGGDVYVQINAGGSKVNSSLTSFGYCT